MSPESVEVALPFDGNGNDKGTLFAGAAAFEGIYAVGVKKA